MSLRLVSLRTFLTDGEVEETPFNDVATALVGPRASSKTTRLLMIDFCLGDSDTAEGALGSAVAEVYLGLELDVEIGGQPHTLRRALDRSFGQLTKVLVDGMPLDTRPFQSWLMGQLNWPELYVPRGRDPRLATEQVPLTFRTLFRHIFRKENSWLELASREEEFLRRAVISFFLGLAEARYVTADFDAGEAERRVLLLEDRLREATEEGRVLMTQIIDGLGLAAMSGDDLPSIASRLEAELELLNERRHELMTTMESDPSFVSEPRERYQWLDLRLVELGEQQTAISATLNAYRDSVEEISDQIAKLGRARISVELIAEIPVTLCPACAQPIVRPSDGEAQEDCYLCKRAVSPDVRERRIDLEINALEREQSEIVESVGRAQSELRVLAEEILLFQRERTDLRERLDRERSELIAPYLTEIESVNRAVGATTQQLATVHALGNIHEKRDRTERDLAAAREALDVAEQAARRVESSRRVSEERCAAFAEMMNDFLHSLRAEPWTFGDVTLTETDLSFYVGPRRWETALGAEAKTLFLVAYHAAMLQLPHEGDAGKVRGPGLAILDNPMQQGVPVTSVSEALDQLLTVARENQAQVLFTLPQALPLRSQTVIVQMEYAGPQDAEP